MNMPDKTKSNPALNETLNEDSMLNESHPNMNETFASFPQANNSTSMLQFSEIERIKAKYANYVPLKAPQKNFTNSLDEFNNIITRAKFAKARARRISIERSSQSRNEDKMRPESIYSHEAKGKKTSSPDNDLPVTKFSNDNEKKKNDVSEELYNGKWAFFFTTLQVNSMNKKISISFPISEFYHVKYVI
jgi:hypothetical protein